MSSGDAGAASRERPMLAFPDKFAIAVLRHPMRTRQVSFVNVTASLGITGGVQAEQNLDGFPPIRSVTLGVQKSHIELHVLAIIRRERVAERWFVQKRRYWLSHQATIVARISLVNLLVRLDALFPRQGWRLRDQGR